MNAKILILSAAAMALLPAYAFAAPGNSHNSPSAQDQTPVAQGQPNQSCEETPTTPGNSADAPGGGSPFGGDESTAGQHYAGSQDQNDNNPASVSQYDVACTKQPH